MRREKKNDSNTRRLLEKINKSRNSSINHGRSVERCNKRYQYRVIDITKRRRMSISSRLAKHELISMELLNIVDGQFFDIVVHVELNGFDQ
jgi:hypothetical protein